MSRLMVLTTLLAMAIAACGGGSGGGACGEVAIDELDPASGQHVTAGTEVVYLTDPPTSGPHAVIPVPAGIRNDPLHPTVQVGVLEAGRVLVQHRDLDAGEVDELLPLVASDVVITPNSGLDAPIVVTAWQHRMHCDRADAGEIQRFVNEFNGANQGH